MLGHLLRGEKALLAESTEEKHHLVRWLLDVGHSSPGGSIKLNGSPALDAREASLKSLVIINSGKVPPAKMLAADVGQDHLGSGRAVGLQTMYFNTKEVAPHPTPVDFFFFF